MVKIKNVLIIMLLGLFVLPVDAYALTGKTELNCDKTSVVPGGIINCTLTGSVSDGMISGLDLKITTSSNLSLKSVKADSMWQGESESRLVLYTADDIPNTFKIATFTVQVSDDMINGGNEKIIIGSTIFSDSNFKNVAIKDTFKEIKVLSNVNTLSNITLSSGTLSPTFNSNTLKYSAIVDSDKVTINATKTSELSNISGDIGEQNLSYGINEFQINVTNESNVIKTYNISINRPDNRDNNNKLSKLILNNKNIELSVDKSDYTLEVESDVAQIQIEAELDSNKSGFIDGFEPRVVNLVEGENKLELKIKAENGNIKTYTLNVIRKKAVVDNKDENKDEVDNENNNSNEKNDTINNSASKEEIDNPKTGSALFYIVFIIMLSIIAIVYNYKKYKKKRR